MKCHSLGTFEIMLIPPSPQKTAGITCVLKPVLNYVRSSKMHPLPKMQPHCNTDIGWGDFKIAIGITTTYDQMVK